MRCHCCDKVLTEIEIQYVQEENSWEMCAVCLEAAMDAAYSDGFQRPDDADSVHIIDDEPPTEPVMLPYNDEERYDA